MLDCYYVYVLANGAKRSKLLRLDGSLTRNRILAAFYPKDVAEKIVLDINEENKGEFTAKIKQRQHRNKQNANSDHTS